VEPKQLNLELGDYLQVVLANIRAVVGTDVKRLGKLAIKRSAVSGKYHLIFKDFDWYGSRCDTYIIRIEDSHLDEVMAHTFEFPWHEGGLIARIRLKWDHEI
jgi:hypothetical protein